MYSKMKPKILDLFCGAGGAAVGLARAGFEVVGVDIEPQYNYPFEFHQADALEYPLEGFDAFWASPPCQHASKIAVMNRILRPGKYHHPDLIKQTRERLVLTGRPYVIENVEGASLNNPAVFCGSWFGLDLRRHRLFESNFPLFSTPCCHYWQKPKFRSLDHNRKGRLARVIGVHGHLNYPGEQELRVKAMGIDWMSPGELVKAVPPVYAEYIGRYLLKALSVTKEVNC